MLEREIVNKIMQYLKPISYAYKTHGGAFQKVGIPDIICCYKGRFVAFEVKAPGKEQTVTPIQIHNIEQILNHDGEAFVVSSVEQVKKILTQITTQ